MSSANMRLVIVKVQLTDEDPEPEPKLDEGEHIVKRIVPLKDLYGVLKGGSTECGFGGGEQGRK